MSHHYIAFAHSARSWQPSTDDSPLEQLVRVGWMIQEGDRPHAAESGCIKHQEKVGLKFEHYIVCELVLSDNQKNVSGGLVLKGPLHHLLEIVKRTSLIENLSLHVEPLPKYRLILSDLCWADNAD